MKPILTKAIAVMFVLLSMTALRAAAEVNPLDENGEKAYRSALSIMDDGNYETAIMMLEDLQKAFPDNYFVRYELALAYIRAGELDKALKIAEKLMKHEDAEDYLYAMIGSCYDDMDKPDKAIKVYDQGIKRFPTSGNLLVNKGITQFRQKKYNDALKTFETSIDVDPTYSSAYYYAALLLADTSEALWAMAYAETYILISNNSARDAQMSQLIVDVIKDRVEVKDSMNMSIRLFDRLIRNEDDLKVHLISSAMEMGYVLGSASIAHEGFTLENIIKSRELGLDAGLSVMNNPDAPINPDRMALLKLQKAVRDAGLWEPYNYYILQGAFPEEVQKWADDPANEEKIDKMFDFLNNYPEAIISDKSTVSPRLLDK